MTNSDSTAALTRLERVKAWIPFFGERTPKQENTESPASEQEQGDGLENKERVGIYLNVIHVAILRWTIGVAGALVVVGLLKCLEIGLNWLSSGNTDAILNWHVSAALILLLTFSFSKRDPEPLSVPENYIAPLTWFGWLFRIYLIEGVYPWTGRNLGFRRWVGRYSEASGEIVNKDGFLYGDHAVPISIWNHAQDKGKTLLLANTRVGSEVRATLTIPLRIFDPHLWIRNQDALLAVAERSRSAFRNAVAFFAAIDNALAKSILGTLLGGKTIVTCFLNEQIGDQLKGSIIQDTGGSPQYMIVERREDETNTKAIERTKQEFEKHILTPGVCDQEQLTAARESDGSIRPTLRQVAESLNRVLHSVGAVLYDDATIGLFELPKALSDAAAIEEAQPKQAAAMLDSAKAAKRAADEMRPTEADIGDSTYRDRIARAAATDPDNKGHYKVVEVLGGAGKLSEAAAVHASLQKKGGDT